MKTREPRPLEAVLEAIRQSKSVALVCHISPDGDTLGSAMALRQGLLQMGRAVTMFCQDKVPAYLSFLPGVEGFRLPENLAEGEQFDLLLCVDISDVKRMGRCASLMQHARLTAQIDHHETNTHYCAANCVDGSAPACALVAMELLKRMDCVITPEIALCLFVGLSTDSGHFSFSSTTAEAFSVMAELMECGVPLGEIHRHLYRQRHPAQVKLLSRALSTLTYHQGGRITSMKLTAQDFADCGALPEHAEDIVNYGLDVAGVEMTVFAREVIQDGETYAKCSLRAVPDRKINGVAVQLGGGGHPQAAGVTLQASLDEGLDAVLTLMKAELEKDA